MLAKQHREGLEAVLRSYEAVYTSMDRAPVKTQSAWSKVQGWLEEDREQRENREDRRREKRLESGEKWHTSSQYSHGYMAGPLEETECSQHQFSGEPLEAVGRRATSN